MSLLRSARPSQTVPGSHLFLILAVAFLALALTGCQFRPLYADLGGGRTVRSDLRGIDIMPLETRVGQRLRNNLIFAFGGGESDNTQRYRLKIILTETDTEVSVEKFTDVPASKLLALTASYTLTEMATKKTILTGSSFANASYDISTQRFANIRAKRDAENRAAMVVSDDIRARISAHFIAYGNRS